MPMFGDRHPVQEIVQPIRAMRSLQREWMRSFKICNTVKLVTNQFELFPDFLGRTP
jgi:hypothetical protein